MILLAIFINKILTDEENWTEDYPMLDGIQEFINRYSYSSMLEDTLINMNT